MKKKLLFLIIINLSLIACNRNKKDSFQFLYPEPDKLIDKITLRIKNETSRTYAYTDKTGGFWQGNTFYYNTYDGGYILDEGQHFLTDWFSFKKDWFIDRRSATEVTYAPHQITHSFSDGTKETLTVLEGFKGFVVNYDLIDAEELSIFPYFYSAKDKILVEEAKEGLFVTDNEKNTVMLMTSANFIIENYSVKDDLKILVKARTMITKALTMTKSKQPYLVCLFGKTKEELIQQSQKILANPASFIIQKKAAIAEYLLKSYQETNWAEYDLALNWNKIQGRELVVTQFGKGIWAGLPWFNQNWGRDTYIALPGISIVTGQFADAREIITNFTNYQQKDSTNNLFGRIPNRVNSPKDIIYNTADGTPLMIREIAEFANYTGDLTLARELYPVVKRSIEGSIKNFMDKDGFLTHDDADTWMDARIRNAQAWSPRGNRAVEVQVLWHNQLLAGANFAKKLGFENDAKQWTEIAAKLKESFEKQFFNKENNTLYDHINTKSEADLKVRPNQLFAITLPQFGTMVDSKTQASIVKQVVSELTYPYGVASLSQNDPDFHPYHHDQIYHFDAAYHNGMCWQWLSGAVVSAMLKAGYTNLAFEHTLNLTNQTLYQGMPGTLSELVEPALTRDGSLQLTGAFSQAWSVGEFVRNFYQDYMGVNPQMMDRKVVVTPNLPTKLAFSCFVLNVGDGEQIECVYNKENDKKQYYFNAKSIKSPITIVMKFRNAKFEMYSAEFSLNVSETVALELSDKNALSLELNDKPLKLEPTGEKIEAPDQGLKFQNFELKKGLKSLSVKDYLENEILKGRKK